MPERKFEITDATSGAGIVVRVVHNASKTKISALEDDSTSVVRVRIKVMSSVDDEDSVNAELQSILAKELELAPEDIEVTTGDSDYMKMIGIHGLSPQVLEQKLYSIIYKDDV